MTRGRSIRKLAHYRARRDLTQAELARLAGVSTATVQRLEAGGHPLLRTLYRIAKALDVSVDELVEVLEDAS